VPFFNYPQVWTRQPQYPVGVAPQFASDKTLVTWSGLRAGKTPATRSGSASLIAGPGGLGYATTGSTSDYWDTGIIPIFVEVGSVFVSCFSTTGTTLSMGAGIVNDGTSFIEDFYLNSAGEGTLAGSLEFGIRDPYGPILRGHTGNIGINDGRVHTCAWVISALNAYRCFVDGVEKAVTLDQGATLYSVGAELYSQYPLWINLRNYRGSGQYAADPLQRIYLHARLPSSVNADPQSLSANPWQLFQADPRPIWTPT